MGTLSREETKDMYSWWWDSHISPKNSKWLQENLTDMDNKIITMIRFIEVDEDSFARRAEMYYKKRPELMKLVEEFYRAYRALAERYDHATGVIRQAHRTMAEVFPNQVPLITDDHDLDPHTPETRPNATRSVGLSPTVFSSFKRNGDFTDEPASLACRKGSKELNDTFGPVKARKGLNFHEVDEKEGSVQDKDKEEPKGLALSESERLGKSETDIQALKEALAKLEAEKEAGLVQYQQTLERLSKLESEVARAQEDSKGFNIRASKAEAEVESLKETLAKVEAEREASLLQYQQCLEKISNLESRISCAEEDAGEFNDRASRAEKEAEDLREELARLKAEKESLLVKYMEALEKIANLENKLLLAEDYVSGISKRADKAEKEVESLKQTISRLTEEKDAAAAYYEQCLEKIASLEREIGLTQEEAERLKVEVEEGVLKLKGAEEQCRQLDISNKSLQSELDTLVHKAGLQNQEILEKQKELSRLWTCVQEERVRFMEAENAFQARQNLHSKTQEELRSVAAELQKRAQILQDMEFNNQQLQDEVKKIKDENKSLNDLKLSSDVSTKSMQDEIFSLKEGKGKLEEELKLRFDKSNALQQEIYCLKEELCDLNQKHREVLEQLESVGLEQECFGSSVKELQDENSKLKESCQKIENDKVALAEKLEIMEKLIEKNALLESSLLDLRAELEGAREKVRALEESCQQLVWDTSAIAREKTTVISQLEIATENLERLSERNSFLENSLSGANAELEVLRAKSKNLEDSCRLLNGEKSVLVAERHSLASDLDGALQSLAHLGNTHAELELRYSGIVEEQETTLRRVEELQLGLDVEKQGHANTIQLSQKQIADLESRLLVLQEAGDHMREEFEQELDKAVSAQLEIFVIQKCVQDLKKKNTSLLGYCEKLLDASKMSEKLILELEHEKFERQEEVRLLSSQIKGLRSGMFKLLKALKMETESANTDCVSEDESVLSHILAKLEDMERSLCKAWDENQELVIEKSVLVTVSRQLKQDVADLNHVIGTLSRELGIRNQQLIMLQKQMQNLLKSNEELILKVKDGNLKEMALVNEIASLAVKLSNLQGAYGDLQKEKSKVIEDSSSLMKSVAQLEAEKRYLDKECSHLYGQVISLDNLCLILKCVVTEKSVQVIELNENIHKLCSANNLLEKKVRVMEGKMEEDRTKHMSLEFSLNRSEDELTELRIANDELQDEIENGKNLLQVKEIELLKAEVAKDDQDKCIRRLSQDYSEQVSECKHLQESIRNLNAQIHKICKEHTETEAKVEALNSELQKAKEEAKLWELVAGTFFTELQSSGVREALLKEKLSDLTKLYENIEGENYSKGVEIVKLRERVGVLEGENADVKAQFDTYISAISSIQDSLASLEKHTSVPGHSGVKEDAKVGSKSTEENSSIEADRLADLEDVQRRITAIEKSVVEIKSKAEHEYSTVSANLDTAMRQIKLLKSQSNSHRGTNKSGKRSEKEHKNAFSDTYKLQKLASVVSEAGDESLTKDIMLDQMSECSPLEKNKGENGKSKDQLVESWETVDQVGSIDLTVGKYPPQKGRRSSESLVEKELGVDEQEKSPGSFPTPHHEENKRVFERLASDIQKLTNLQITVQDLKAKLDSSSTDTSSKYDGVKEQLEETERGIIKWFDYVGKLMKKLERSLSSPSSFDGPSPMESSDGGSARQRSVSDKARRVSDKIGRLQMEVQKVQFLMMKLDNERPGKSGTRITERSTRILLRDYIYGGGTKTPRRPKKSHFCGCMQPPTKS